VKAAFQARPSDSPVRILLATDAASEGIDLQNHCARLVHYEIPWNPNRMEQRNGRVDRHGQREKSVQIFHFVGKGWREADAEGRAPGTLEGDLEFLARAARKVETIREDLGKVGPVIASQVEDAMLGRRRRLDVERAVADAEPGRRMLKIERDVRARVAELASQLRETREELGITPETVRRVVDVGLATRSVRSVPSSGSPRSVGPGLVAPRGWRTRSARSSAPSSSTMRSPRGGRTWSWSTSTTGWSRCALASCGPRSGSPRARGRLTGLPRASSGAMS
jgi:superfamily II DNA/RNA helicase